MIVNQYERDREILAELTAKAESYARDTLMREGRVSQAVIMDTPNGHVMVVAEEFSDGVVQDRFGEVASLACISQRASAVVFVSACWVKLPKEGEELDASKRASEYPDRQEMLLLKGEAGQAAEQKLLPMMRSASGKFIGFGNAHNLEVEQLQGRVPQILPDWHPSREDQERARWALYDMAEDAKRERGKQRGWER